MGKRRAGLGSRSPTRSWHPVILVLATSAWGAACHPQAQSGATNQPANPPAPPVAIELPADVAQALPRTDAGLPILMASDSARPGRSVTLAYDSKRDDPLVHWGECLSRIVACYDTNAGPIAGCIDLVPVCASDEGGMRCCPQTCIAQFKSHLARGWSEERALEESFLKGDCIRGFAAFRDAAGAQP